MVAAGFTRTSSPRVAAKRTSSRTRLVLPTFRGPMMAIQVGAPTRSWLMALSILANSARRLWKR